MDRDNFQFCRHGRDADLCGACEDEHETKRNWTPALKEAWVAEGMVKLGWAPAASQGYGDGR